MRSKPERKCEQRKFANAENEQPATRRMTQEPKHPSPNAPWNGHDTAVVRRYLQPFGRRLVAGHRRWQVLTHARHTPFLGCWPGRPAAGFRNALGCEVSPTRCVDDVRNGARRVLQTRYY